MLTLNIGTVVIFVLILTAASVGVGFIYGRRSSK